MKNARILIFADGHLGEHLLRWTTNYDPRLICGLVLQPGNLNFAGIAHEHSIPHFFYDIRHPEKFALELRATKPNIVLLAPWPLILKEEFLALGQDLTLSLHPSLLPHARGKDPIFWTIIEERPFGVSIHHVSEEINAGDVAFQREIAYTWEDTEETLYRRAIQGMVWLFCESYPRIVAFDVPRHPQVLTQGTFHSRKELDVRSLIDLEKHYTGRHLLNILRARTFEPHDACRFVDGGETYEVRISIRRKRLVPRQLRRIDRSMP